MRALGVLSLLVAGASAGIVLSDHSTLERLERKVGLSALTSGATAQPTSHETSGDGGWRVFSPQRPLTAPNAIAATTNPVRAVEAVPKPQAPGPVVETATIQPRAPGHLQVPVPVPASRNAMRPTDEAARYNLARDIQTELRRVGCYDGHIDGDWGPAVKRAMKSFTDRVNAVLPLEQPDYILLTLVKGHVNKACGAGCAPGEVAAEGGRCVPKGVIAQPARKRPEGKQVAASVGQETPAASPAGSSAWSTTLSRPVPAAPPAPVTVTLSERASALPGRMTVGGPSAVNVEPLPSAGPAIVPTVPAASGVAAAAEAEALPPVALEPAPAPKRKASSGNGRQYRDTSRNDRSFKNPQVVREFFFGRHGG